MQVMSLNGRDKVTIEFLRVIDPSWTENFKSICLIWIILAKES
jgi:hypothetical protein